MISFELPITVTEADLDELNHVNNVVYLQWVQDVAKGHWEKIAPVEVQQKYVWMVLRHEIDYASQAMLGDQLIAKTWVEWSEGVRSERRVEIRQATTGKIVIKAATLWCLLDAASRRPKRIETDITSIFHN